jgi:hypothetical protein
MLVTNRAFSSLRSGTIRAIYLRGSLLRSAKLSRPVALAAGDGVIFLAGAVFSPVAAVTVEIIDPSLATASVTDAAFHVLDFVHHFVVGRPS